MVHQGLRSLLSRSSAVQHIRWLHRRVLKEGEQFLFKHVKETSHTLLLLTWIPLVNLLKYHTHNENKEDRFGMGIGREGVSAKSLLDTA